MSALLNYCWPEFLDRSGSYALYVEDTPVCVFPTKAADYAIFSMTGPVNVKLCCRGAVKGAVLRPVRAGVQMQAEGNVLGFTIHEPGNFLLEIPGLPDLFLYANPPEKNVPDKNDTKVKWFAAGQVYDVNTLCLESGQTVYIEGGAVLKGCLRAAEANNVTVRGRGVIDASFMAHHSQRMLVFEGCEHVELEGILTTGTPSWNTVFGKCRDVHVDNYKTIGWQMCSDGIDVVGSENVLIENCCIRSNDDCIVVKSVSYHDRRGDSRIDWRADVKNVVARNCVLYNSQGGNAMEIGYETQADVMEDIVFENIDVIGAHGMGGVFTIHNGDRALIRNVRYENIHVEHFYDKIVDFFIQHSRYSRDDARGRVEGVLFKDIYLIEDRYNTLSIMGGFDADHRISDVTFDNFNIGDKVLTCGDDLNLYTRHVDGLKFV